MNLPHSNANTLGLGSNSRIPPIEEVTSLSRRLQGGLTSQPDRVAHWIGPVTRMALKLDVYRNNFMIEN